MSRLSRREILALIAGATAGSALERPLGAAVAATPASARASKIVSAEVIPTRVPMHERVREAWQRSFRLQNRFQTHYKPVIVKLTSEDGLTGIGDADMPDGRAKAIAENLVGHSPWEHLLDDSLGGILVAVYDLLGQAAGLPVSRLFSTAPKHKIVQTWWSQCFPPTLMASEAKLGYELGYRVHKVKARPWEDPFEQGEAICEAIGPDMRVWADANAWWRSVGRTRHFVEQLAQLPNYFAVESHFPRDQVDDYRALKDDCPLQLAEHMPADPMPFIREGLLSAFVVGKPMGARVRRPRPDGGDDGHPAVGRALDLLGRQPSLPGPPARRLPRRRVLHLDHTRAGGRLDAGTVRDAERVLRSPDGARPGRESGRGRDREVPGVNGKRDQA